LLVHSGFGAAQLEDQNSAIKDKMINFIIGATGQIKLSNKLALTGDFTTILNARQSHTFDAASVNRGKGFSGILFNGTIGLTLYLGKNKKHADWVILIDKDLLALKNKVDSLVDKDILALKNRVDNLENNLLDSDKDGIADYLDQEAGTIPDHMVNSKGKSIDLDNNGIPDELESYLTKTYANRTDNDSQQLTDSESITKLVNGGYVAAYFDFNKSTPTDSSIDGINFILNYLRNNPSASVEIIGHADEIGNALYNEKLSNERANSIKNILLKANIAASRISVVAAGEDTSVDKGSTLARKLARRATFKIKD
jgi:OOP family OmpA-OmpF porin